MSSGHPDDFASTFTLTSQILVPVTNVVVPAGTGGAAFNVLPSDLVDLNDIVFKLPAAMRVRVQEFTTFGDLLASTTVASGNQNNEIFNVPYRSRGNELHLAFESFLFGGTVSFYIRGLVGAQLKDLRLPSPVVYAGHHLLAPANTVFDLTLPGQGRYDRIAWAAYGDGPWSLVADISNDVGGGVVSVLGFAIASSGVGGGLVGVVDVPADLMTFNMRNDDAVARDVYLSLRGQYLD